MKALTYSIAVAIGLMIVGCRTPAPQHHAPPAWQTLPSGSISLQRAVELAVAKTLSSGRKPKKYVIERVNPITFGGRSGWRVDFQGKVQTAGNHHEVFVDGETGECKLFHGQ